MKCRATLTPRAQADLEEIWDYTAARWGPDQAESYLRLLWKAIEEVTERPAVGKVSPDAGAGYRSEDGHSATGSRARRCA